MNRAAPYMSDASATSMKSAAAITATAPRECFIWTKTGEQENGRREANKSISNHKRLQRCEPIPSKAMVMLTGRIVSARW
ncbi:hypothetical protein JQ617_12975 [Bradyrhizobium sp. KB893862 SZCCT0404]|uniref:hypothetical protein n=1 Tax=Bradyrhizobium sp. KB893862 SZCCT0404 TaxID=2807672 RepID=UPI001BA74D30|nr:hypothetical protein [Bradyrhizobium sp. KB893862 SZCCT0404]